MSASLTQLSASLSQLFYEHGVVGIWKESARVPTAVSFLAALETSRESHKSRETHIFFKNLRTWLRKEHFHASFIRWREQECPSVGLTLLSVES